MRVKKIRISFERLREWLTAGRESPACRVMKGLPEGARICTVLAENHCSPIAEPDTALLFVEHPSFPANEPDTEPEEIEVWIERSATLRDGAARIAAERARQAQAEGFTSSHDDAFVDGALLKAAEAYLCHSTNLSGVLGAPRYWPWSYAWWKPNEDPVRNLEKAGALIAAEIDRLLRERGEM